MMWRLEVEIVSRRLLETEHRLSRLFFFHALRFLEALSLIAAIHPVLL